MCRGKPHRHLELNDGSVCQLGIVLKTLSGLSTGTSLGITRALGGLLEFASREGKTEQCHFPIRAAARHGIPVEDELNLNYGQPQLFVRIS
ncbi:hypothetical protein ACLKA6_000435 [Drosophila palustris]